MEPTHSGLSSRFDLVLAFRSNILLVMYLSIVFMWVSCAFINIVSVTFVLYFFKKIIVGSLHQFSP